MQQCQGHTGNYFDYKCYKRLKDYYDLPLKSEDGINFLDGYKNSIVDKQNIIYKYYDIFKKLTIYLAADGLSYYNKSITCSYINYWLNQEILVRPELNASNFIGFLTYADEYAKFKNGEPRYMQSSCRNYFSLLVDNKYKKMDILYKMYHYYNEIKGWNEERDKTKICNNFKLIEKLYYNIVNEHKGDEDLNNKLKIFKDLVIKPIKPYNVSCDFNISNLMPHEIVSPRKEEPPLKQEQSLASQQPSQTDLRTGLEETDAVFTHPTDQSELQERETSSGLSSEETLSETTAEMLPETSQEHLVHYHNERPTKQILSTVRLQGEHSLGGSKEQVPRIVYEPENSGTTTSHAEGILGQITGAFSNIVENVETAPILGVSGGMGALYLLLRYTPVRRFLGGGRGRSHGIPSGFPGAYPGFPEYYDGNFGNMPINISYQAE